MVEKLFDGMEDMDFFTLTCTIYGYRTYIASGANTKDKNGVAVNDGIFITMDYPSF